LSKEDFPLDRFPPYCSGSGKIQKWTFRKDVFSFFFFGF